MKKLICFAAIAVLAGCMGGGTSSSTSTSTSTPATVSTPAANTDFSTLLNGARASTGAGSVTYDARLARAAQVHADDMFANGFLDHVGSDNSEIGDRVRAQGYNYRKVGENIARGQQTEEAVFNAWQNSTTGHRENNLDPEFDDYGLAKAGSGSSKYWVLVLGTEQ